MQRIPGAGVVFAPPKTKRSRRIIRVGDNCIELLREYRQIQREQRLRMGSAWVRTVDICGKTIKNDLIFTRADGTPFDPHSITSWFSKFLKANDLTSAHFHSLRHSNATLLIADHVPVSAVSGRLGHANISTTLNIYTSAIQSADAAAANSLESTFERIKEKNHA